MSDDWINVLKGNNMHEIHGIRHLVGKVMKNTIREAIIDEHSAIAICFGIHYRTIVGIEGDKVYYKDSFSHNSIYPDETHEMTIDAIIDDARVRREFAGNDSYTFPIELFWMKDIPAGTDIAKKYQGKIDKTVVMTGCCVETDGNGKYLYAALLYSALREVCAEVDNDVRFVLQLYRPEYYALVKKMLGEPSRDLIHQEYVRKLA